MSSSILPLSSPNNISCGWMKKGDGTCPAVNTGAKSEKMADRSETYTDQRNGPEQQVSGEQRKRGH